MMGRFLGNGGGLLEDDNALDMRGGGGHATGRRKSYRPPPTAPTHSTTSTKEKNKSKRSSRSAASSLQRGRALEEYDEDMVRTRRYWEKWAAQASTELLKNIYDDVEGSNKLKELVYSGKCGPEPKYKTDLDDSDSEGTDISLLTTSTLTEANKAGRNTKKRGGKSVRIAREKTDWEKLAKERANKGVLDKLIRRDASRIERYMKDRHAPIQNVMQQTEVSDLMEQVDQSLIRSAAYSHGLSGARKSQSTENLMSAIRARPRPHSRAASSILSSPKTRRSHPDGSHLRFKTARTPSPAAVARSMVREQRPETAFARTLPHELNCEDKYRLLAPMSPLLRHHVSPYSAEQDIPDIPTDGLSPEKADEKNVRGAFLRSVHRRMHITVQALDRNIGYGDDPSMMVVSDGDRGRYTAADYARVPRYPQNIRIAPQLGNVIRNDIRQKMGKPRQKAIRVKDVRQLDAENPRLGRAFRNMIIFNWLNELERTARMSDGGYDVHDWEEEEERARHVGFRSYGDVTDVMSITTRPSTAFTSLYSGRVSDDEDQEYDMDELSMATGSACYISSAGGDL